MVQPPHYGTDPDVSGDLMRAAAFEWERRARDAEAKLARVNQTLVRLENLLARTGTRLTVPVDRLLDALDEEEA